MTGTKWREAREAVERTIRAVAAEVGVTAQWLSDLEHGRRTPSDELDLKLRKALKLPPPEPKPAPSRCAVCDGELAPKIQHVAAIEDHHGVIGPGYRPIRRAHDYQDGFTCKCCGLHYDNLPFSKEPICTP
jgi:transcriptional regulator with XRE-family HTH domain